MPRETIRRLAEDTERLLVAGAHLAPGNPELTRDQEALAQLIAKLGTKAPPVFAQLAALVAKTLAAGPKEQAGELVALATAIAQVRAGLAQPAPVLGDEVPLERAPEVPTPCNAKDLYAVHDALVVTGPGRMAKIEQAVERGDVVDLRLVHAVVQAMGDTYVGPLVSDKVVPRFGRAIAEPVRRKLHFPGSKIDARRLRALVAVEGAAARPLIDQAIGEGSAELRAAALDAIADHLPGLPELEEVMLSLLASERSWEVRRAAVRALAGYGSEVSFERLLAALDDQRTTGEAAEALGRSTHPQVVDRLLERLDRAVADAQAKVAEEDKKAVAARNFAESLADRLLRALAKHADPRVPRIARGLLAGAHRRAAAGAVLAHGSPDDLRAVVDLLAGDDSEVYSAAVAAALKLPPEESFERLIPFFRARNRDSASGRARLQRIANSDLVPDGERWVPALLGLLRKSPLDLLRKPSPPPEGVVRLLGRSRDPRAVEPLLALLTAEKKPEPLMALSQALGELGDKRAIAPLLARIGDHNWQTSHAIVWAIQGLADETTVGAVRTAFAALEGPDLTRSIRHWALWHLLRWLERKYPGC